MATRKYGTCFFEQYAQISLAALLGHEYDRLVNRDRPDLQSEGDRSIGIEVTRAMPESKEAHQELLKEVAGISTVAEDDELGQILESGYAYGLREDGLIGSKELPYWSMALPLRRIIRSKVSKVGNGFYGTFDKMGLYVFCKDPLGEAEVLKTMRYTSHLQQKQEIRYGRLYLSEPRSLYVCELGAADSKDALQVHPVTREQRKAFYLEAVRRQIDAL
ncbi:MAG: hypothetical protein IJM60_08405 [Bacteroidales bacterium]|nr:hypothetical protein [Bacteroidales bacterium]